MSIVNSLASVEEDPPSASERTSTIIPASSPGNDANRLHDINPLGKPLRRRRWKFRFRRRSGDRPSSFLGRGNLKTFSFGCGTNTIKRSNQIQLASFVELLGCLIALVCGMFYIGSTSYFYEVDISPEKREQEYDEKLERAVFLEKTRIGVVGLLATCVVGVMISMFMAVGICCKSWECFRTALTLLFSVNIFHFLLTIIYLPRGSNLLISIVAIPIRIYEFILIRNHIRSHKRKRFAELKEKVRRAGGSVMATSGVGSQYALDDISLCSFDNDELMQLGELRKSDNDVNCIYNCPPPAPASRKDSEQPVLDTMIMANVEIGTVEQLQEDLIGELGVPKGELVMGGIKNRPKRHKLMNNDWKRDERAVSRLATTKYTFNQYDMLK